MKYIVFSIQLCLMVALGCTKDQELNNSKPLGNTTIRSLKTIEVPDILVNESLLLYDNSTSQWTLNDSLFSGYKVSFHKNGTIKEKTGIYKGKRQNKSLKWYPDGKLQVEANYHKGKLHGAKKLWSMEPNHALVSYLNYDSGKVHGEQKQWYKSGEVYKTLNFVMGREEGLQQAYRKNGELYANYEAKEGRIFGLKKAALCYGLQDENINYDK